MTLEGVTYCVLADGASLPGGQPAEIAASISAAAVPQNVRDLIKEHSPHCKLIAAQMIERIRARYSIDDEMFFARIGVGAAAGLYTPTAGEMSEMAAFGAFVESVRQWGRDQRTALGL